MDTSVMWVDPSDNDLDDFSDAVNMALAQAKASGDFNGPQGPKGDAGTDGEDGVSPTVDVSKSGKVTTISITDKNGTKTATVNDGADGPPGSNGKDGTSVTVESVSESSADGGSNVVTFSDGKTLTVKNGSKGTPGTNGTNGKNGTNGAAGKSAYAYAQDGGFTGTETEFSENLASVDDLKALTVEVTTTTRTINLNPGGYEYGYLKDTGAEASYNPANISIRHADYVPVQGGKSIMFTFDKAAWNNNNPGSMVIILIEYDSNKNFIASQTSCKAYVTTARPTYALNANTSYIRISITNWTTGAMASVPIEDIKIGIYYAENATLDYVEYESSTTELMIRGDKVTGGGSSLAGKRIVYDGDSICLGYNANGGYPAMIASIGGCTAINEATGGARLCAVSDKHSVVNNVSNLPKDGDLYCFQGGINDWWANTPLGTFTQSDYTGTVDPTTIYGAMETIFRYALTNFVGKPICFVITHKIQNNAYSNNTNGHTFWDYRKAMIDVCEKYSIPYYDAFGKSGLNGWNDAQNNAYLTGTGAGTADGIHPNVEGYKRYYVPQLLALFREIMPVE